MAKKDPNGTAYIRGPYEERRGPNSVRWLCDVVDQAGNTRQVKGRDRAAVEAQANELLEQFRTGALAVTVGAAVKQFLAARTEHWSPLTVKRTVFDLNLFAMPVTAPITAVDADWLRKFLKRMNDQGLALGSQRTRWASVVAFLAWCVYKGWLQTQPDEKLDRMEKPWLTKRGRRTMGRGKPQLKNSAEVAAYLTVAAQLASAEERVGAMLPLLTGMRNGEVLHLKAGDVDHQLEKIWVRGDDAWGQQDGWHVKSSSSTRTVGLPAMVKQDLATLQHGREPGELLLAAHSKAKGDRGLRRPHIGMWLSRLTKLVSEAAHVTIVTPHGLRGTYGSMMAALARSTPAQIGDLLGHADAGTTARRHYIGEAAHTESLPTAGGALNLEIKGANSAADPPRGESAVGAVSSAEAAGLVRRGLDQAGPEARGGANSLKLGGEPHRPAQSGPNPGTPMIYPVPEVGLEGHGRTSISSTYAHLPALGVREASW